MKEGASEREKGAGKEGKEVRMDRRGERVLCWVSVLGCAECLQD